MLGGVALAVLAGLLAARRWTREARPAPSAETRLPRPLGPSGSSVEIHDSPVPGDISGKKALEIAKKECAGVLAIPDSCRITVTYAERQYTVTFWLHPPLTCPGSSYHGRIILRASDGQVLLRLSADA